MKEGKVVDPHKDFMYLNVSWKLNNQTQVKSDQN